MMKKKVYQLNAELFKVTGIQRVLLDIHEALRDDYDAMIAGTVPYEKVDKTLGIERGEYMQFRNPLKFRNSTVIIHERRLLPLMWILTHIPGLNIKCVYVHHNELYGNKRLSLFPNNIVAISDAGIRNLTNYFGVSPANITKIHNCVRESLPYIPRTKRFNPEDIRILYPARINSVKRQIEIVKNLRGKLRPEVRILFAGTGPQYEELKQLCHGDSQFIAMGFRDDILEMMKDVDFMMLFSQHEGLPISLIEAIKSGLPVVCNDVGGNTEIVEDGKNGIVVNDWNSLLETLNRLPSMKQEDMDRMSEAGREIYENNFNFEIFKYNYRKLIKALK